MNVKLFPTMEAPLREAIENIGNGTNAQMLIALLSSSDYNFARDENGVFLKLLLAKEMEALTTMMYQGFRISLNLAKYVHDLGRKGFIAQRQLCYIFVSYLIQSKQDPFLEHSLERKYLSIQDYNCLKRFQNKISEL